MNVFHSDNCQLRLGWKVLRVFALVTALAMLFALLAGLLHFKPLGHYAVHLAMIAGTLVGLRLEHRPLSFIGMDLRQKVFWTDALLGLAWGSLLIGLVVAGMVLITGEMRTDQLGEGFTFAGFASPLLFWLVVAIGEESLFRGYTFSILREGMNVWLALIISACLFGAIHLINTDYYWFAYIHAILIGVAFGGILIKRGNLGGAIGFHYGWNLLQDRGILNTPASGGEWFYGIVLLLMTVSVFWLLPPGRKGIRHRVTTGHPCPP